jgi:hypothetical protein
MIDFSITGPVLGRKRSFPSPREKREDMKTTHCRKSETGVEPGETPVLFNWFPATNGGQMKKPGFWSK